MGQDTESQAGPDGWGWFDAAGQDPSIEIDQLAQSFLRCFAGSDGEIVLRHLRQSILDRRLGPTASDAELRFLEGQRSVVAHIISMNDRGRG